MGYKKSSLDKEKDALRQIAKNNKKCKNCIHYDH